MAGENDIQEFEKRYGAAKDVTPEPVANPNDGGSTIKLDPAKPVPLPDHPDALPTTPAPRVPNDDATGDVSDARQAMQQKADVENFESLYGGGNAKADETGAVPAPTDGGAPAPKKAETKTEKPSSIVLDIAKGLGPELDESILGGVRDAIQNTMNAGEHLASAIHAHLPDMLATELVADNEGVRLLGKEEFAKWKEKHKGFAGAPELPKFNEPTSVTGGLVKGISQFSTGFFLAGKATGLGGGLAASSAKGMIADFTAFDEHSANLANLVEKFPILKNPVTHLLATTPDDSFATGRLKNAITGFIGGVATQKAVGAFVDALRYLQQLGGSNAFAKLIAKVAGKTVEATAEVQPYELYPLGDPNGALFTKRAAEKLYAAEEATAGLKPSDVKGKLKKGPEYEINFAAINTRDDVKQVMRKMAQRENERITEGKGGVQTWEQTAAKAEHVDAFEALVNRREGDPLPAHELLAAKAMYVTSAEKLHGIAQLASKVPTDANLVMLEKMAQVHSMVQKEFLNATSEVGRALNILKLPVGGSKELASQIDEILTSIGGSETVKMKADRIAKLASAGEQEAVDAFVNGTFGEKLRGVFDQVYINGLYAPKTIAVKIGSDFANMFKQVGERKMAEVLSEAMGTQGGVVAGEWLHLIHGYMSGFGEGMYALGLKFKEAQGIKDVLNAPADAIGKVRGAIPLELPPPGKLAAENWGYANNTWQGIALDTMDKTTTYLGRMISSADMFMKLAAYRGQERAMVLRQLTHEMQSGLITKEGWEKREAEIWQKLASDPRSSDVKGIFEGAVNEMKRQTFTGDVDPWLKDFGKLIQRVPILGRMTLPFKLVPANMFTQMIEGTPMAPLMGTWRADIAAGGARADLAIARTTTGTALLTIAMDLARKGIITGKGPEQPGERNNWVGRGNESYQLNFQGEGGKVTRLSYTRLGPLGDALGLGADITEAIVNAEEHVTERHFTKVMAGAVGAIANNVLNKSFMEGFASLMVAIHDPTKREGYLERMAGSFVPGAVKTVTRVKDPYMRAADGMVDSLRRQIPALAPLDSWGWSSNNLAIARDNWGRPKQYASPAGWVYDAFSPYTLSMGKSEPIEEEFKKLAYYPGPPRRTVSSGSGQNVELNAKQYSRLKELAGNGLKDPTKGNLGALDFLNAVVTNKSPTYSGIYNMHKQRDAMFGTDEAKTFLRAQLEEYRQKALGKLIGEDVSLQHDIDEKNKKNPAAVPAKIRSLIQQ